MSMMDNRYLGAIYHHGVIGQRWGVRRSPEQLGHISKSKPLAKFGESARIEDGCYRSDKGFRVSTAKLEKYCLQKGRKHAQEFFDVGYTQADSEKLFRDIEAGFDLSKKQGERLSPRHDIQFGIPMQLGVSEKQLFTTAWQIDKGSEEPKLISAYRDRRVKEDE